MSKCLIEFTIPDGRENTEIAKVLRRITHQILRGVELDETVRHPMTGAYIGSIVVIREAP